MSTALLLVGGVSFVAWLALRSVFRSWLYDRVITRMTAQWYRQVLERVPSGAKVLDVGIGTGTALVAYGNDKLLRSRRLRVHGCAADAARADAAHVAHAPSAHSVDYDGDYVEQCAKTMRSAALDDIVSVELASIYDFHSECVLRRAQFVALALRALTFSVLARTGRERYDAVYFSGSLMIMPDPAAALTHCASLLAPNGRIYLTQTFEEKRNRVLEWTKPLLKHLTTIDFGQVTYEHQFLAQVEQTNLRIVENSSFGDTKSTRRTYRLVILEPQ